MKHVQKKTKLRQKLYQQSRTARRLSTNPTSYPSGEQTTNGRIPLPIHEAKTQTNGIHHANENEYARRYDPSSR